METPRTGIDNPSFETDKTDVPKPLTNGHNGTVTQENGKHEKDKMAEAVNLELINMKPFAKSANGRGNGVPAKKKETSVNMNDTYDDYFIPVNEHKKYMRYVRVRVEIISTISPNTAVLKLNRCARVD